MARKAGDRYICEKCGAVLVYENAIVRPGDTSRVQVAFAQSNGVPMISPSSTNPAVKTTS